jgi:pimeloyl-ACP methyl ester carboxylesterase
MHVDFGRREFLRAAVVGTGAAVHWPFAAQATGGSAAPADPLPLRTVLAASLEISYAELGPPDGEVVILLHGWPYDIHSFAEVAPRLAREGRRVIVPYLRGFGGTRFLAADTLRNGQPAAVASDTIAMMDALNIPAAVLAGFDWGAVARALQGAGIGERLPDRQSGRRTQAAAPRGRAAMVVPILFRH